MFWVSVISLTERAGIRTPDNLIKSQVLYHLSYTPIFSFPASQVNWASWIRTSECRSQSPVPYRLAIAHRRLMSDTACQYEYKRKGWVVGLEPTISRTTIWRANQLHHTHHNEPGGFEPSTYGLEGRCSIQLSYRLICKYPLFKGSPPVSGKAGDGNRTHVSSLEGWCSTIELHPHINRGDRIRTCDLLVPNQAL